MRIEWPYMIIYPGNIGGHYTMDVDGAVEALKLLQVKNAIPMHYNTFPPIKADMALLSIFTPV